MRLGQLFHKLSCSQAGTSQQPWKLVKVTQIWTHLRSSHKKPRHWSRCCWVNYFTSLNIMFTSLYTVLPSATLKAVQEDPKKNRSETFPWRAQIPNKVLNAESVIAQVIIFTCWYMELTPATLKVGYKQVFILTLRGKHTIWVVPRDPLQNILCTL